MWDWLQGQANRSPERLALDQDGWRWTFLELSQRVDGVVGFFHRHGVGAGDRIAVLLSSGYQWVEIMFAAIRLRAVLVPLNVRLTPEELAFQIHDADPSLVVASPDRANLIQGALRLRLVIVSQTEPDRDVLVDQPFRPAESPRPEDIQSIMYTSGTTGSPKGAMIRLQQHWWGALGSMLRLGHLSTDGWLMCMPLYHVGGQAILLRAAIAGVPVYLEERFEALRVAGVLRSGQVTLTSLVPTMLQRLLDLDAAPFSPRLRAVLMGGSRTPPALMQEGRRRGLPLLATYGMTETASQMATQGLDDQSRPSLAARPLDFVEITVRKDGKPVPPGTDGEILVRGPQVIRGYWNRPEATEAAFDQEGWFRTGDIGRLEATGYLTVLDRRSDLILSGGENVYPAEVEAALMAHPLVRQAAVIGVPDREWGQVPAAFLMLEPGAALDAEALTGFLSKKLARYKVPKRWEVVEALPVTGSGKIRRQILRERFALPKDQSS